MKARLGLFATSVAAFLLGGCATPDNPAPSARAEEPGTYLTGSRIPVRDTSYAPVQKINRDDWEHQQKAISGGKLTP